MVVLVTAAEENNINVTLALSHRLANVNIVTALETRPLLQRRFLVGIPSKAWNIPDIPFRSPLKGKILGVVSNDS